MLDILVQSRRNAKAAKWFFCKLLKGLHYTYGSTVLSDTESYLFPTIQVN